MPFSLISYLYQLVKMLSAYGCAVCVWMLTMVAQIVNAAHGDS